MLKRLSPLFICILIAGCQSAPTESRIHSADIDNFWTAYDLIVAEPDSIQQLALLNEHFIDLASPGQEKLFEVRNYTPEEYIQNINRYPKFYTSLRGNFERKDEIEQKIAEGQDRLREIYPALRPGKVSIGMGNMRTPGTTVDTLVLIGAELAFGDPSIDTSEFPPELDYVTSYYQSDPIANVGFLGVHEFIHTQQSEWFGTHLLSAALREGSAEFIAELVSGEEAPGEIITIGKEHHDAIFQVIEKQMFNASPGYWLWNNRPNPFGQRDLGYYVGYAISQHFYDGADDKDVAVAQLMELDYADARAVESFVDDIGFFEKPIADLKVQYQMSQPTVLRVDQAGDLFTIHFSQPMDIAHRGFDYGPLGEDYVLPITEVIGFSPDSLSMSVRANVEIEGRQQVTISRNFRNADGIDLLPFVVEKR